METKRWNIKEMNNHSDNAIEQAANLLKSGKTVSFPTETVYGIGADATSEEAVAKIFQAKGRPNDNPLIAHVASKSQLKKLVAELPPVAERLIDAFTPGPITFVLPNNGKCAKNVTVNLPTIAVRIPEHPTALRLLQTCGIPIAAPSANLSGRPSPTTAEHVWSDLKGKIAGLLDDGATGIGVESTVIDCTVAVPVILRPGGISKAMIEAEIGHAIKESDTVNTSEKPNSPGMKYTHYAPSVPLWLVDGGSKHIQDMIIRHQQDGKRVGVMASNKTVNVLTADHKTGIGENLAEIAAHIYDALRSFDQKDVDIIICETFPETGIGKAVMNRLKKASSVHVPVDTDDFHV